MSRRSIVKKSERVTAETARRITGITTPFGGIQWADPGPSEREHIRRFILFLEDRRALFNPQFLEVPSQVDHSIHEIRKECTDVLRQLGESAFATLPIRAIREAGRRFHDDCNLYFLLSPREFRSFRASLDPEFASMMEDRERFGFFVALGGFRSTVGHQVALLAAHYDLDVEGDLAKALPKLENNEP